MFKLWSKRLDNNALVQTRSNALKTSKCGKYIVLCLSPIGGTPVLRGTILVFSFLRAMVSFQTTSEVCENEKEGLF